MTDHTPNPSVASMSAGYKTHGISLITHRLTNTLQRTECGQPQRLALLGDLLVQISKRLLEARVVLAALNHAGDKGILSCIVASDAEDGAIANVLGRVRTILFDVSWAAGHVADYGTSKDDPGAPLNGWSLEYSSWYGRSTVAMLEALFNNDVNSAPDELWPVAGPVVASLIKSLQDWHAEAQAAHAHIGSLMEPSHQQLSGSTPSVRTSKAQNKVQTTNKQQDSEVTA